MKNIDFTYVECWGFSTPRNKSWTKLVEKAFAKNDKQVLRDLETSLKWNVESSYYRLVGAGVKDLDSDIEYFVSFINGKKLWDIEIKNSKSAEVLPEDRDDFFNSEEFKKLLKQASTDLDEATKLYKEVVKQHIEAGELMEVDETKLERIIFDCNDKQLMKNLKTGKHL